MTRRRMSKGSFLPLALSLAALMLTLAALIAAHGTVNLNMAGNDEQVQRATDLAYSGLQQYLYDLEDELARCGPLRTRIERDVFRRRPSRPGAAEDANRPRPYPMPGSHLAGEVYITFNRNQNDFPWSTNNLHRSVPDTVNGYRSPGQLPRVVPANTIHVIATGVAGRVRRSLGFMVSRRWDYAITVGQKVRLKGTDTDPMIVDGDIISAALGEPGGTLIHVGKGSIVRGDLATVGRSGDAIRVEAGADFRGTVRKGARGFRYPELEDVEVGPDWINLKEVALNAGLSIRTELRGEETVHFIEAPPVSKEEEDKNAAVTSLSGQLTYPRLELKNNKYHITGTVEFSKNVGGLNMDNAILKVTRGSLLLERSGLTLNATDSVISVDDKIAVRSGVIEGGQAGFVLRARSIEMGAGGTLYGLIIVDDELKLVDRDPVSRDLGLIMATPAPPRRGRDGELPLPAANAFSASDLTIRGAILATNNANTRGLLELTSANLIFDSRYVWALNEQAPLVISNVEEIR